MATVSPLKFRTVDEAAYNPSMKEYNGIKWKVLPCIGPIEVTVFCPGVPVSCFRKIKFKKARLPKTIIKNKI